MVEIPKREISEANPVIIRLTLSIHKKFRKLSNKEIAKSLGISVRSVVRLGTGARRKDPNIYRAKKQTGRPRCRLTKPALRALDNICAAKPAVLSVCCFFFLDASMLTTRFPLCSYEEFPFRVTFARRYYVDSMKTRIQQVIDRGWPH